jgi:hypothetical protein
LRPFVAITLQAPVFKGNPALPGGRALRFYAVRLNRRICRLELIRGRKSRDHEVFPATETASANEQGDAYE